MGWLWSSSAKSEEGKTEDARNETQQEKKQPNFALTDEQRIRIFGKPDNVRSAGEPRDQQADKDLEAFFNSFVESTPDTTEPTSSKQSRLASEPQQEERTDHDRINPDGSLNIHPLAIYPRTMSCRQAFDQAYYCQSLAGKFHDIYRYGRIQSCSEQWGAFWFCMRVRTLPQKDKESQIRDYYADRDERRRKEFGNSENVWEIREKAVDRAFWKDPDVDGDVAVEE